VEGLISQKGYTGFEIGWLQVNTWIWKVIAEDWANSKGAIKTGGPWTFTWGNNFWTIGKTILGQ